jgi:poly-gamma-glutamate capsule biosynthesis protein CapA/YwtB (metallophosphatase superfamily)
MSKGAHIFAAGSAFLQASFAVVFLLMCGCDSLPPESAALMNELRAAQTYTSLTLAGDVLLSPNKSNRNIAELKTDPCHYIGTLGKLLPFIYFSDIAFCNLECPLSLQGTAVGGRTWNFRGAPAAVDELRAAGFDVVGVSNNHVLDFGKAAYSDTLANIQAAGLLYTGISENGAPQVPAIVEGKDGLRIAFLAYCNVYPEYYYAAPVRPVRADRPTLARDIQNAKTRADIIVVTIHWGAEYATVPSAEQMKLGREMIDLGATVVAGHHPHVLQEPEFYHDGIIIYSLGNFLFEQGVRRTPETRLYRILLDKQGLVRVAYIPAAIQVQPFRIECNPCNVKTLMERDGLAGELHASQGNAPNRNGRGS